MLVYLKKSWPQISGILNEFRFPPAEYFLMWVGGLVDWGWPGPQMTPTPVGH